MADAMVDTTRSMTDAERAGLERERGRIARGEIFDRPGCMGVAMLVVIVPGVLALVLMPVFQRTIGADRVLTGMLVTLAAGAAAGGALVLGLPRWTAGTLVRITRVFDRDSAMKDRERSLAADLAAGVVRRVELEVRGAWEPSGSVDDDSPTVVLELDAGRALVINSQRLWDTFEDYAAEPPRVPSRITVEWLEHTGDLVGLTGEGEPVPVASMEAFPGRTIEEPVDGGGWRECYVARMGERFGGSPEGARRE